MTSIKSPKKLIEVALPLDDINREAAREKSIRHGHPSTLHLWWARRPLAAARAVLFAQMVNDPGYQQGGGFKYGVNKIDAAKRREELFNIIRELVKWENTNNEAVLERARAEIRRSWREICELNKDHPQAAELFDPDKLPAFHDPFAGGGAIPLEAQRLGLEAWASDLNPVAVMINKAMIEIPPRFAGRAPVGPIPEGEKQKKMMDIWPGATGLAEDVRRYGHWMREEAEKRIGHLYPRVKITPEMVAERPDLKPYEGQELTVIAWLWARTVKSPNPAFSHVDVPLASSFVLSSKKGKEAWVEPVIEGDSYRFEVRVGKPPAEAKGGTTAGKRNAFRCLMSGVPIDYNYIRSEGKAGRMGVRLMAIVAEGNRGRVYLPPLEEHEAIANEAKPNWEPETPLPDNPRDFKTPNYGMKTYGDLFTPRQLVALTTFSDLVQEARARVIEDARKSGWDDDLPDGEAGGQGLDAGGTGATAYGDAVAVYLAFAINKGTDYWNAVCTWMPRGTVGHLFARHAIPMAWDYPEANPFSLIHCSWEEAYSWVAKSIDLFRAVTAGVTLQDDASEQKITNGKVVSTDPPYYDNIGYADLSDFFYVWIRRSLKPIYPGLFATLAVPKAEELVATPYRHGSKEKAESFFLEGMKQALHNLAEQAHPAFPVSIYYAFKQSETKEGSTTSTGWETFLEAVIQAGFTIDGTWPLRTERSARSIGIGTNALASSVVLVCRRRPEEAGSISRKDFQRQLRREMPEALEAMTCLSADLPADSSQAGGRRVGGSEGLSARQAGASPIAPVDLAQAAIGPGMAIFSRYEAVLNQDGSRMQVADALILINRAITDYLSPESGSFDADTQFCSAWFEQYGWNKGPFGEADVLARAKGTSVDGVVEAGVLASGAGRVRLLKWKEYPADWDPTLDERTPVWEALHHMIRRLNEAGESAAGELLARMPEKG